MTPIKILFIWIFLFLLLPQPFIHHRSVFDQIIAYWLILSILVNFYELIMVTNRQTLCINQGQNFWNKSYSLSDSLKSRFWLDGWGEYSKLDPRYCNPNSSVHTIELLNVVIALIPAIIILMILVSSEPIPTWIGYLAIVFSSLQFLLTMYYYATLYPVMNTSYAPYAFFDLPWLIMPIVTIGWGLQIIKN